eukprot:Pgem_evm1s8314
MKSGINNNTSVNATVNASKLPDAGDEQDEVVDFFVKIENPPLINCFALQNQNNNDNVIFA